MPFKGVFTQAISILLTHPVSLEELEPLLTEYPVIKRRPAAPDLHLGAESLIVAYRPEVNGYVQIDVQDGPWPDSMGGPDGAENEMVLGAWMAGAYGPFAYPQNLERAVQQDWVWGQAKSVCEQHAAFLRIRLSYMFGAAENARAIPEDCNPTLELVFLTLVAIELMNHPATICYFNPNGEVVLDAESLKKVFMYCYQRKFPPVSAWCNVRHYATESGWLMSSTVGMQQLDLPDLEAWHPANKYSMKDVGLMLQNCALYLLENGTVIGEGNTMDGPGGIRWRANQVETKLVPPREVIRWLPADGSVPPSDLNY
jgi:hypothetical protein